MGIVDAFFGRLFSKGVELELRGGINASTGLKVTPDTANERNDLALDFVTADFANIEFGNGFVSVGASPASTGELRFENGFSIIARDNAGVDTTIAEFTSSDYLNLGDDVDVERLLLRAATLAWIIVGGSARIQVSTTSALFNFGSNDVVISDGAVSIPGYVDIDQLRTSDTASATTPGNVTDKMPVYDAAGSLVGYVAIYDAIT